MLDPAQNFSDRIAVYVMFGFAGLFLAAILVKLIPFLRMRELRVTNHVDGRIIWKETGRRYVDFGNACAFEDPNCDAVVRTMSATEVSDFFVGVEFLGKEFQLLVDKKFYNELPEEEELALQPVPVIVFYEEAKMNGFEIKKIVRK